MRSLGERGIIAVDMPRLTLAQRTAEEQREAIWLRAVETGTSTVQDLAMVTGLSVRRIQERLKRALENRVEIEVEDRGGPELDEATWLELVGSAEHARGPYYHLPSDATSLDGTGAAVLVGNHNGTRLRRQRLGTGDHVRDPGGPTTYQPDAGGLKGGVG